MSFRAVALAAVVFIFACCSDDDSGVEPELPKPAVSIADRTVSEGSTILFNISLSHTSTARVTFQYTTQEITAMANNDYMPVSGSDTIQAGNLSSTILVNTVDDSESEMDETLSLILSSVTGATFADSVAIATITASDTGAVSFANDVRPILQQHCSVPGICHGSTPSGGGLFLGLSVSYDTVVNAIGNNGPAVVPSNSSQSYLYLKTTPTPPFPSRMPPSQPWLSTEQQETIREWIDDGALDN